MLEIGMWLMRVKHVTIFSKSQQLKWKPNIVSSNTPHSGPRAGKNCFLKLFGRGQLIAICNLENISETMQKTAFKNFDSVIFYRNLNIAYFLWPSGKSWGKCHFLENYYFLRSQAIKWFLNLGKTYKWAITVS